MKPETVDILWECPCNIPHGHYDKRKDKYNIKWEEYVAIWSYTCLVGSINHMLLENDPRVKEVSRALESGLKKLENKNWKTRFAVLSFVPPFDWNIKTFRSTSYEIDTPFFFFDRGELLAVFDDVRGVSEISDIAVNRHSNEVLIPLGYQNFSLYDIDYFENPILYFKRNSKKKFDMNDFFDGSFLDSSRGYTFPRHDWNPEDSIDAAGNNILHYFVDIRNKSGIWKYRDLMNTANDTGITPAMKLARSGQYSTMLEYSDIIDFKLVDKRKRNILHYLASLMFPRTDEIDYFDDVLELIIDRFPDSINQLDVKKNSVFDLCNYVEIFLAIEKYNKSTTIDEDVFYKIFVSPSLKGYSEIQGELMLKLVKKYNIGVSEHFFMYFSLSIDRLELLKRHRLLKKKTSEGDTILHVYLNRYQPDKEILEYLLENLPPDQQNNYGETPAMLFLSAFRENYRKTLFLLKEYGANFYKKNIYGNTQSAYIISCLT